MPNNNITEQIAQLLDVEFPPSLDPSRHKIPARLEGLLSRSKKEVLNFIDFLLAKRKKEKTVPSRQFDFAWEGGLANLKDTYTVLLNCSIKRRSGDNVRNE